MNSRDTILGAIKAIEMDATALPDLPDFDIWFDDPLSRFKEVVTGIGAQVYECSNLEALPQVIKEHFDMQGRIVSTLPALSAIAEMVTSDAVPQSFEDVELAIIKGDFGVAENGAIWMTEAMMGLRVLPFICQRLIIVIDSKDIVPMMPHAYNRIGAANYAYGTFIAGPSKTADIEQSLVLGAHGARSLGVVLLSSGS